MKLVFTDLGKVDLTEIWLHNVEQYDLQHADEYREFLLREIEQLKEYPEWGKPADGYPKLRYIVMKRRSRGHGHAAYYEILLDSIRRVRILHTAMYAPDHLDSK